MKKMLLLLLAGFTLTAAHAQQKTDKAEVTEGPEVPKKGSFLNDVIGHDESGYYIQRNVKKKIFLEHIDKQTLTADRTIEIPKLDYNGNKREYEYTRMIGKTIYLFSSVNDKETKTNYFFAQKVDPKDLSIDPELKKIYSGTYETRSEGIYNTIPVIVSPDETKILTYRGLNKRKDESNERILYTVFDDKFKQLWEEEVEFPYPADMFSVYTTRLGDDGNIYVKGVEYQTKEERKASRREGKQQYTYHLLVFKAKSKTPKDYKIQLEEGKFITDMQIELAPTGNLVAAGFYSNKGSSSVKGAFYMSIDAETRQVLKQKTTEFPLDFITQNMTEREKKQAEKKEKKGKEPELLEFDLDDIVMQSDGGVTLIAEQFFIRVVTTTTTSSNGSTTTRTTYHYYYNDIIALSFNGDGTLAWKCKIPKRQHTVNDGGYYSSYAYAAVGDKLYFVFNDNPKNLFLKDGEVPYASFRKKEIAVSITEVNANTGKTERELLFTTERGDILILPKACVQSGDKEMLLYGERRRKTYQFSRVEFKTRKK